MQLKQLFDDDRAVSPVIGVILMVAITVILAAVIGTFVLGLGDQIKTTTPTASFETDYSQDATPAGNDTLELTHGGGDTITANQVTVTASDGFHANGSSSWYSNASADWSVIGSDEVNAGSTVKINNGSMSDYTVRVVWSGEDGDSSSVLAKWTGPDA